uniref:Uncharacterized protein n=1 Tax=Arundo donax TaxID=35708 RepID=A0A0A9F436_ARUDO
MGTTLCGIVKLPAQPKEDHLNGRTARSGQGRPPQRPRQHYKVLPPPLDMSEAAAAPAVGTIPVVFPGFDRCSSGARYSQNAVTAETTSL